MRTLLFLLLVSLPTATFAYEEILQDLREPSVLKVKALPINIDGIPRGASRVKMLSLSMRASCEQDAKVKNIRVQLIGPGDKGDIRRIYLMKGNRRLTRGRKFSSDRYAELRTRRLTIPACKTEQVDVVVDFERTATVGGKFILGIENEGDITTNVDITEAEYPIRSFIKTPTTTPYPVGEISIQFLPIAGTISAVRDELLGRFYLSTDNKSHHMIRSVTLTNKGSASDDDLRNMYMTRNRGRAVTQVVNKLDGDQMTFKFSRPFFLKAGQKVLFQVRGSAYTSSKTINFTLEEPSDLVSYPARRAGRNTGERLY